MIKLIFMAGKWCSYAVPCLHLTSIIDLWYVRWQKWITKMFTASIAVSQCTWFVGCHLLSSFLELREGSRRSKRKRKMLFLENRHRMYNALFIAVAKKADIRLRTIYQMIWCVKFTWASSVTHTHTHEIKQNELL